MLYFAYGSNLDEKQLRNRVGSLGPSQIGLAFLSGWRFVFDKKSTKDGTAKANIVQHPGGIVWGFVYLLTNEQFKNLEKAEGGYYVQPVSVWPVNEKPDQNIQVLTFISSNHEGNELGLERKYVCHVILGAKRQRLPRTYRIELLRLVRSRIKRGGQ